MILVVALTSKERVQIPKKTQQVHHEPMKSDSYKLSNQKKPQRVITNKILEMVKVKENLKMGMKETASMVKWLLKNRPMGSTSM